jgi:oligopeptide transport system permease protein
MDIYYSKKGPHIAWLSENFDIMNGGVSREGTERNIFWLVSTGIGAAHTEDVVAQGTKVTFDEGMSNRFSPIGSYKFSKEGPDKKPRYSYTVDAYMEVGFIYTEVTQAKLKEIEEWQEKTGIQVLYPLIEENEYTYHPIDTSNANFWFKTNTKGDPIKLVKQSDGTFAQRKINFEGEAVLEDNYMRDADGNVLYSIPWNGGDNETSMRRVRVLYYNYYIYQNGFEPNYIFGTDSQGYDLALRMADGIGLSLLISVIVSAVNFVIGAIYGAIAGYYGGAIDLVMERITDILNGIPSIIVMTLFQIHFVTYGITLSDGSVYRTSPIIALLFAFFLTGWIGMSSRVRTQFYRFKNQEYVMAARTLGANDWRIIWKHIFPNTLGTIITGSVLAIPGVIFTESMLSFLGIVNLGGSEITSLGTLLSDASNIWTNYPHLMLFPALVISLLMICFNLFGNGLRDAFNPSLRGVEE